MLILFNKAHIPGYTKKDGTYVPPHETKAPSAKPEPVKAKVTSSKPAKAQFDPKAPLPDDAYANVGKPVELPPAPAPKKVVSAPKVSPNWPYKGEDGPAPKAKWVNKLHSGGAASQGSLFGSKPAEPKKPHYPNAVTHPKANDEGKPFQINEPSKPTGAASWTDPDAVALFTPGGEHPAELNGVPIAPWTDAPKTTAGWEFVEGQMKDLAEPPLELNGKAPAAGVIIEEPDGRIWVVRPTNGFAGYSATFPKGHADDGLSLQATAIKECFEESGLKIEITGLVGDVERTQTVARYYRARRVGGSPTDMGWETQGCALVPKDQLHEYLNTAVDRKVASKYGIPGKYDHMESADDWEKVGKQAGSNPGGIFEDEHRTRWYLKMPKSTNIAKNEVLAAKLYEAAGIAVPELKFVRVGDKVAIASKMVDGLKQDEKALKAGEVPGAAEGFAVDAWLANWDAVGLLYDNLLIDSRGKALRVDVGGSLVYRAQGEPKGKYFGDEVGELKTLRNGMNPQAAAVFGKVTDAQVAASVHAHVAAVPNEKIRQLCMDFGPGTKDQRAELAEKLIKRKNFLLEFAKKTSA